MKVLYESEYCGYGESASKVIVYELSEKFANECWSWGHADWLSELNLTEQWLVAPGASYHRYSFEVSDGLLIVIDRIAYNV